MADRTQTFTFEFEGKQIEAREGDSVASALYRAGRRIFTRSFKYHRPRGLLCVAGKCPNCLMDVDNTPNVRTCITPAKPGMRVRHQNAYPSLDHDWLSVVQRFDRLMPVGWYYKTMTHEWSWHAAEGFIRKAAGLGIVPSPDQGSTDYEHGWMHAEVAVIGGGPGGLNAAFDLAKNGAQVTLIDDQLELGGHLRYRKRARAVPAELIAQLRSQPRVEILSRAYCFGLYEGNLLGVLQSNPHPGARERLIHLRAKRVVVATGAYETPFTFENNDLPGVMLSSAVQRLIHLHGIKPGERAVVVANGEQGEEVAADLQEAGVEVITTLAPHQVVSAIGSSHVTAVRAKDGEFACDLVVMCGQRVPDAGLLNQAGGKLAWSDERGAFLPVDLPANVSAAGEVTGAWISRAAPLPPKDIPLEKRAFVCFCSDVSTCDLRDAIGEGFEHIETLKRYTTLTMGPCQGKMCQLAGIGVCAHETGRTMGETGATTSRPPNPSVSLGALAGARHHPIRRTPMHYAHDESGAVWMDMGEWKRPRYYKSATCSSERTCVEEEYRAVRERVGLIDVSTLGKLDVKGRDAGRLLDKVYTNRFSDLKPGRVRYSVLCDEAGIMLDDGTISRLAEDHYFITTTTGNLDFVQQWLEWWLIGTGWDVHITNVTGGRAAVNLAGPQARDVLKTLTDCDLSTKAFPYMSCREAEVAGVAALLLRIGFVGETGWEVHFPAEYGEHLWRKLLDAGGGFGIRPFGVEAQRWLRLEKRHVIVGVDTDALSNPYEADMAWVAKLDKNDFIGRNALRRLSSAPAQQNLVGFVMLDESLPQDGAAILVNGSLAGRVTSARYSPANGKAVGLAWLAGRLANEGAEIDIRVDGRTARARLVTEAFYDPPGARLRM
ncbi:MAG TPA: 2Fe-2S iron-sulfur cluster-binding protein [Bryobacteraceae bacterium]|nr:2Fe-2S iron-sulfur cluster-binding protein [Bryobacteraceae bacterium]